MTLPRRRRRTRLPLRLLPRAVSVAVVDTGIGTPPKSILRTARNNQNFAREIGCRCRVSRRRRRLSFTWLTGQSRASLLSSAAKGKPVINEQIINQSCQLSATHHIVPPQPCRPSGDSSLPLDATISWRSRLIACGGVEFGAKGLSSQSINVVRISWV